MRLAKLVLALAAASCLGSSANAADKVKVGFLSTLSGPGAGLGVDIRDGFNLAIKHQGGKLGGLPAEVIIADDQQKPEVAQQVTEKFLKKDKVDFMTGIVFSNIMLAVGQPIFDSQTFFISANAGPSQYAGEQCNPYFFNVAWQNDNLHEAVGKVGRKDLAQLWVGDGEHREGPGLVVAGGDVAGQAQHQPGQVDEMSALLFAVASACGAGQQLSGDVRFVHGELCNVCSSIRRSSPIC